MSSNSYISKNATEAAFRKLYLERTLLLREVRLSRWAALIMFAVTAGVLAHGWPR